MNNKVADQLKNIRLRRNLTQLELANKLDTRENYISDLETGKRPIALKQLKRICEALNVSRAIVIHLVVALYDEVDATKKPLSED